jgi:hypothetical protein
MSNVDLYLQIYDDVSVDEQSQQFARNRQFGCEGAATGFFETSVNSNQTALYYKGFIIEKQCCEETYECQ